MPKNQTVSIDIAPLIPSHSPLMANIATPIGWKIARCSSLGQPRRPAPDGRENAGEAGEAAKNAVQKAHAGIRRGAASLDGLHPRSGEAISAVERKHHADRDADVVRTGPSENRHAQGDSNGRPQQEWPQSTPPQRVP